MEGIQCRGSLRSNVANEGSGLFQPRMNVSCRRLQGTGGSNSSVANGPLVEPGRTSLYVGLPSEWGSVDGDFSLSSRFVGQLLSWGLRDI